MAMTAQELLPLLRETSDGKIILPLHVQPGAKRDAVVGIYGDKALKLATTAPPVDGKANAALKKLLSRWLGVPQAQIELKSGLTGRDKQFVISGIPLTETVNKLVENSK